MPENPLLPNAELRALFLLLQQAEGLTVNSRQTSPDAVKQRGAKRKPAVGTEALLAATLLQMQPGDLVLPEVGSEAVVDRLRSKRKTRSTDVLVPVSPESRNLPRMMAAAGVAAGLRRLREGHFVVAFCRSSLSEPRWVEAITWAQEESLPLITVCVDASGAEAFRDIAATAEAPSWTAVQRVATQVQLPVLAVDGQDAVAVYRVVQESILRARALGGPVVIWAVLPTEKDLRRPPRTTTSPLQRLEEYLRVRKLPIPVNRAVT